MVVAKRSLTMSHQKEDKTMYSQARSLLERVIASFIIMKRNQLGSLIKSKEHLTNI